MRVLSFVPVLSLVFGISLQAFGDTVTGWVMVEGSGINQTLSLKDEEGKKSKLCMAEKAEKILKLTDRMVRVEGDWKLTEKKEKDCFTPAGFQVVKLSTGRPPHIGLLQAQDGVYLLKKEDGTALNLPEVSSGMKKFVGKKVILDLKTMESVKGPSYKVVSFSEYP